MKKTALWKGVASLIAIVVVCWSVPAWVGAGGYVNHGASAIPEPLVVDVLTASTINVANVIASEELSSASLAISGGSSLTGSVITGTTLAVGGTVTVANGASIEKTLGVGGEVSFGSTLTVSANLVATGSLISGAGANLVAFGSVAQTTESNYLGAFTAPTSKLFTFTGATNPTLYDSLLPDAVNPTINIYSSTLWNVATDEKLSLTHDVTDGVITTGSGMIKLDAATGVARSTGRMEARTSFDVLRVLSGDSTEDADLLRLTDGSTVEMKFWWDDNILTTKCTSTFDAPNLKTNSINAAVAVYGVKFYPNTSGGHMRLGPRGDAYDTYFEDKSGYVNAAIVSDQGTFILAGSTGAAGSALTGALHIMDGIAGTLYSTISQNGDTLQIGALLGNSVTEITGNLAVSGTLISAGGDTITIGEVIHPHYAEMYVYDNSTAFAIDAASEWHGIVGFSAGDFDSDHWEIHGSTTFIATSAAASGSTAGDVTITYNAHGLDVGAYLTLVGWPTIDGIYAINNVTTNTFAITAATVDTPDGDSRVTMPSHFHALSGAAGKYFFHGNASLAPANNNDVFDFALFVNATPQTKGFARHTSGGAGDYNTTAISMMFDVVVDDQIWIGVRNNSGTGDMTPKFANMTLHEVSK